MAHAKHRLVIALLSVITVAGCITVAPTLPGPDPHDNFGPDDCDAAAFRQLIGTHVAETGLVEGPFLRIFGPGAMVTEDFRPDRANVVFDASGRIVRAYCG